MPRLVPPVRHPCRLEARAPVTEVDPPQDPFCLELRRSAKDRGEVCLYTMPEQARVQLLQAPCVRPFLAEELHERCRYTRSATHIYTIREGELLRK